MKFACDVRCLSCGHDELTVRPHDDEKFECIRRTDATCGRCGKTYRLSLTMVKVPAESLAGVSTP